MIDDLVLVAGGDAYYNDGFYYAASNAGNTLHGAYTVYGARLAYLYERWNLRTARMSMSRNEHIDAGFA